MTALTDHATEGLRERKKRETRQALHQAALRLASERGVAALTAEEIAAAAGVSTRTFFNYFSSKEEAIAGHDPERAERLRAAVAERPAGEGPLKALRAVLLELAEDIAGRRGEWARRQELIRSEPGVLVASLGSWAEMERALVEGVAERIGADPEEDLYPGLLVAAATGATRAAALRWHAERPHRTLAELFAEALDLLAAGLPAPAGAGPGTPR